MPSRKVFLPRTPELDRFLTYWFSRMYGRYGIDVLIDSLANDGSKSLGCHQQGCWRLRHGTSGAQLHLQQGCREKEEVEDLPYVTPSSARHAIAVNEHSMYIAVAKCCDRKSTDETVDLNEKIDISQKLITNFSKRETSDSFDPASRKPPSGPVRAK